MNHSFDVYIAKEYGLHCAIILQNIAFWIEKNKANEKHFHDGTYWTYNSVKAFGDMFPYLTTKQIRTALQRLEDEGLVKTGKYNDLAYDHTKWYALTEKGNSLFHLWKYDLPQRAKGNASEGKAIPDINTDNKPDNIPPISPKREEPCGSASEQNEEQPEKKEETKFVKPTLEEVRSYCRERNNNVDAQAFIDFYESKGWLVGRSKMKDWKAAVRTWEHNRKKQAQSYYKPQPESLAEKYAKVEEKQRKEIESGEYEPAPWEL